MCWSGLPQLARPSTLCQPVNVQLTQQPQVNSFSQALRSARGSAGLSQRALARACGLTPAYMSLLEGGRRRPERGTVERIAAALSLDDAGQDRLLLAAGYAPGSALAPAATGALAEVQAVL